jgi:transposase
MTKIKKPVIHLTLLKRQALSANLTRTSEKSGVVLRSKIILLASEGINMREIGRRLGCHYNIVAKWIKRWHTSKGLDLEDAPRSGRPIENTPDIVKKVVDRVCTKPPPYLSRWSIRTLASDLKMPNVTIQRILCAHDLHPHRLRTFTYSPDPQFEDKLLDVVGIYMKPPENAIVLCVDEKTGIQALERTQKISTLKPMRPRAWTNEYVEPVPVFKNTVFQLPFVTYISCITSRFQ